MKTHRGSRGAAFRVFAGCAMMCALAIPAVATRDTTYAHAAEDVASVDATTLQQQSSPDTSAAPSELQERVEQTASAYNDAVAARTELQGQIDENEARIAELQAQLPELRDHAAAAIKTSYKYQTGVNALLSLVLSSDDFPTLISAVEYLNSIQEHDANQIDALVSAQQELEDRKADLNDALAAAQAQEQAAADALEDAKAAREAAIAAAQAAAAQAARAQAEAAAAQAVAAAQAANPQAATDATAAGAAPAAGEPAPVGAADAAGAGGEAAATAVVAEAPAGEVGATEAGAPSSEAGAPVETAAEASLTSDRDAFIAEWSGRIDAYLAGSPMAGHGATFAAAAWDYGVDPRFSPAIAYVESSLGAYCFLPYNAWGWGSSSWGSWDEAIYAQVAGLSRGYGPTLDYGDALDYCPPNADYWYSSVSGQMAQI